MAIPALVQKINPFQAVSNLHTTGTCTEVNNTDQIQILTMGEEIHRVDSTIPCLGKTNLAPCVSFLKMQHDPSKLTLKVV